MLTKQEAAEWADALDSGKYERHQYDLCKGGGGDGFSYCCIGVLGVVRGLRVIEDDEYPVELESSKHEGLFFIRLNDVLEYDFPQIAQIIRQRYLVEVE